MKARKVKGLDPEGRLADNARRIVQVRLAELYSFAPRVLDPSDRQGLHDMRIAAKRLRYVLEATGPSCFGQIARRGASEAKSLQTLLGDIHDCDEMLPTVEEQIQRLRAEDTAAVRLEAGNSARDLDPAAVASVPNRRLYRGLGALATYSSARREILYARFLEKWASLEQSGFREQLEDGLAEAESGES